MSSRSSIVVFAFLALAGTAAVDAQTASRKAGTASVTGAVYDSISSGPLAGASVYLTGTQHRASTDARGRFRIDSVAAGRFVITFSHATLDSLGVAAQQREIELREQRTTEVSLAIPSMRGMFDSFCPGMKDDRNVGVVVGVVRDVATDNPIAGAQVTLRWTLLDLTPLGLVEVPRQVRSLTNSGGAYGSCGVPSDVPISAQVRLGEFESGEADVQVGEHALARRDLTVSLAPRSSDANKGGILTGVVRTKGGRPLSDAQVQLVGTPTSATTDSSGTFRLVGLPAGTQTVEVRRIGYMPARMSVDLLMGEISTVDVELSNRGTLMSAVRIKGQPVGWDRNGFEERRRKGIGHFISEEEIAKKSATHVTQLMRGIPGLNIVPTGMTGYSIEFSRSQAVDFRSAGACPASIYLDGMPLAVEDGTLDSVIIPRDVRGIELYPGAATAPIEFSGTRSRCGVILIWTKSGR